MTEKQLQSYLMKVAQRAGYLCHKVESRTSRGFPDLILISPNRVDFIELKSPNTGGRLSVHQVNTLQKLRDQDANVHVINSTAQVDALFTRIDMLDPY